MKKIVALVLSLVMVLGLATTAFAAIPQWVPNTGSVAGYDVFDGNNVKVNDVAVGVKYTAPVAPTAKNGYYGNIGFYQIVVGAANMDVTDNCAPAITDNTCFVLVESYEKGCIAVKAHDKDLPQGGEYYNAAAQNTPNAVYFLKPVTAVHYNWTVAEFDDFGTMCGDVVAPAFVKDAAKNKQLVTRQTVSFVKDEVFGTQDWDQIVLLGAGDDTKAATGVWQNYLVDGVVYTLADVNAVTFVKHDWVASKFDDKGVVTQYTCATCKVVGTVVASPFLAPADAEIEQLSNMVYVYFYVGQAAAGDKVESAQTFDAGIAMYVGMSVMAAAGSAVVLKKKD